MEDIRHLENRHHVIFFCLGWSDLDKISQTGAEGHVDCSDMVEIETRSRIPVWRTFGRIQGHVISEPRVTLQGAATWRNQCHDRVTLQGVRIPCAISKIVIRHIVCFLNAVWALTSGGFRIVFDTLVSMYIVFNSSTAVGRQTEISVLVSYRQGLGCNAN